MVKKGGRAREGNKKPDDDDLVTPSSPGALEDVMNQNLFADRFSGLKSYLDSFRALLLEEIRAEMSSNLETLPNNSSSTKHIQSLVRVPTGLRQCPLYRVTISDQRAACAPCIGDIVVLTDTVPRRPSDLASNGRSCCLAHVKDVVNRRTFLIRAAK
ncbi:hypothetical protein OsI_17115 [Oryza sativa Indica Group]|uniref:Uncharacterized protein n=1 Tax=Oryza sativa subsp. indica TaxID=39946 RepID=B8ATC2_ORYSI|nr:hypothetical protein OsI_17115 [Oryza sativa Indica Group]